MKITTKRLEIGAKMGVGKVNKLINLPGVERRVKRKEICVKENPRFGFEKKEKCVWKVGRVGEKDG